MHKPVAYQESSRIRSYHHQINFIELNKIQGWLDLSSVYRNFMLEEKLYGSR